MEDEQTWAECAQDLARQCGQYCDALLSECALLFDTLVQEDDMDPEEAGMQVYGQMLFTVMQHDFDAASMRVPFRKGTD